MKLIFTYLNSCGWLAVFLATQLFNNIALATGNDERVVDESSICIEDIPAAIDRAIDRPELKRSRWGIEIQTDTGETIYSKNGNQFFTPASSAKLLVTAAALSSLGADYRLATPVFAVGEPPHLTSLRLKGKGDPTVSTKTLKHLVHQLQALGVEKIDELIIDDSYFDAPAINPTWEWLDVHSYFATAANSTILNQNAVTLTLLPQKPQQPVKYYWSDAIAGRQWQVINRGTTGAKDLPYNIEIDGDLGKPVLKIRGELAINETPDIWDLAVVDPANYFLESLRSQLTRSGITVVRGRVTQENEQGELEQQLLTIPSPAIAQIITEINQASNNLYAEALARVLAKKLDTEDPISAIEQSLSKLGIDGTEYILVDASGLSRQNLLAPQTIVKLLNLMSQNSELDSKVYRESLAVAGVSGTLKNRFRHTVVENNFWGKTGTLTGIGSLSGYLLTPSQSTIYLSIIVNNSDLTSRQIRQAIDRVVKVLNHIKQC